MQQNLQTVIKSFFIFGVPIFLSIFAAFELGYFNMATKPSNHNLNGMFYCPSPYITCKKASKQPIIKSYRSSQLPFHPTKTKTRKTSNPPKSTVLKKPLALFSQSPMTGFYRDGYCRTGPEDGGNHAVAGVLTKEFLDFSASRGNNLRSIGLEPGCKWCLCTARWKEAMEAAKGKEDPVVPKYVCFDACSFPFGFVL